MGWVPVARLGLATRGVAVPRGGVRVGAIGAVFGLAMLGVAACSPQVDDSTPEGAATLFLEAVARSERDPKAREEIYRLLDSESRRRLAERARMMTALGASDFEPWEMIVEGRVTLHVRPRRANGIRLRAGADSDQAVVVVTGRNETERMELPMRREPEGWRVVLAVPDGATPRGTTGGASGTEPEATRR